MMRVIEQLIERFEALLFPSRPPSADESEDAHDPTRLRSAGPRDKPEDDNFRTRVFPFPIPSMGRGLG